LAHACEHEEDEIEGVDRDPDRAYAAAHLDEIGGETGPAAKNAPDGRKTEWKNLEERREYGKYGAFSGNFPRRYYPDRVQRVSLSLAGAPSCRRARSTPVSSKTIKP
jgi:hypothetical protein